MRESDFGEFAALLDDVAALLPPPQPLTGTAKAMYFRSLAEHDLAEVRAALDAHVKDAQRGRWFPKPADLIAQLQGNAEDDGRPGAEEAWAIALLADDEARTVVWTAEIAEAMSAARPVLDIGDKVGARMAFREAYERLIGDARKTRRPVQWQTSLGHDPRQRADAIRQAVDLGRLPREELQQLPYTPSAHVPLLEVVGGTAMSTAEQQGRAALRELRNRLAAGAPASEEPGPDGLAKLHTRRRQDEIAEQVRAAKG